MLTVLTAEVRLQLRMLRRTPDRLLPLVTVPLFTAVFLAIIEHAGRGELAGVAVIGGAIIGIWSFALYVSGDVIDGERRLGTLEGIVASPTPLVVVLLGRIGTVTAVSFLALAEAAVVAAAFGVHLAVHHKILFAAALICTWFAMTGTALIMAGLFVLTRAIGTYQNALTYPFYVLSGAVFPLTLLPGWLRPLANAVFLTWSAELLRACMAPGEVSDPLFRLGMILLLGLIGLGLGLVSMTVILRRIRHLGTIGHE